MRASLLLLGLAACETSSYYPEAPPPLAGAPSACSAASSVPARLDATNAADAPVDVFQVGTDCIERLSAEVGPGETWSVDSTADSAWTARDADDLGLIDRVSLGADGLEWSIE